MQKKIRHGGTKVSVRGGGDNFGMGGQAFMGGGRQPLDGGEGPPHPPILDSPKILQGGPCSIHYNDKCTLWHAITGKTMIIY